MWGLSITEWIQIVSAIGTLGAGVAAWMSAHAANKSAISSSAQLKEMKQQRISQSRPDIYITNEKIRLKYNPNKGYGNFIEQGRMPALNVINAGEGHAKNVDINWYFDIDNFIKIIQRFDIGKYIYEFVDGKQLHTENGLTFLDKDVSGYVPVLLKDSTTKINIPFSYLETLSFLFHLHVEDHYEPAEIPSIQLTISYKDIYSNITKKEMLVTPKIINQKASFSDKKVSDYDIEILFTIDED